MKSTTNKLVMTALLTALVCVATMSIRIPTPSTGGYIHPGDALVILSGIILGPTYGLFAAGIGSAMADLIGGYFIYIPITFFIKGLVAFISGFVYRKLDKSFVSCNSALPDVTLNSSSRNSATRYLAVLIGGVADLICVATGYFAFESFLYGVAGAYASVPANIIQGLGGIVISIILYPILYSIKDIRKTIYTQ